jgi:hypothetical protein
MDSYVNCYSFSFLVNSGKIQITYAESLIDFNALHLYPYARHIRTALHFSTFIDEAHSPNS